MWHAINMGGLMHQHNQKDLTCGWARGQAQGFGNFVALVAMALTGHKALES